MKEIFMSNPVNLDKGAYYTANQAAEIMDCTRQWINQLIQDKKLDAILIDNTYYMIKKTDLDVYKASL